MSTDARAYAQLLTASLHLDSAPVALRFVTNAPADVPVSTGNTAAGCALWRRAESATFFAPTSAHTNCTVGMHTQGLPMTPAQSDELMGLIGQMGSLEYMAGQEVPNIPTVPAERTGANGGIIEGPLADLPDGEAADVVLLWVNGEQAMLLNEAFGGASWGAQTTPVFGRPACAAIPGAMRSGRPSLSLGCAGMRTFTEISKDKMLAVIPASALATVADNLRVTASANESMDSFYADRRSALNGS